jgi:NarL family two-component system response regulator LiaR
VQLLEFDRPARVLIAEEHPLLREALVRVVSQQADLEAAGEAEDGYEALELCRRLRPDLVVMGLLMPRMNGIDTTRAIKQELPRTIVLVLTALDTPNYLAQALNAGAAGYILKKTSPPLILDAIRRALNGESPLDQEVATRLLLEVVERMPTEVSSSPALKGLLEENPPSGPVPEELSPREMQVLRLMVRGQTNREIANNLSIALTTAKNHVQRIFKKLGVSDRTQAAVRAIELGLVDKG